MIKWNNIAVLVFALVVVILLLGHGPRIGLALASMKAIGPGGSTEDKTLGLITLGLVGVCLVAIVRLLTNHNQK